MKVAVTGGIAEGKSTVLGYVAEMGFETASADEIAREVFDDPLTNHDIARLIGVPFPASREDVRDAIVDSADLRRSLNEIMHPMIRQRIRASQAQFVEIPLLIETCDQGSYDEVWVVTCGFDEQFQRLTERVGDAGLAESLLSLQLPTSAKLAFSDRIIRTNTDPESVREIVKVAVRAVLST